jgi:putative transposase
VDTAGSAGKKSLKPQRKRPIVDWLRATFSLGSRRACRLLLYHRFGYCHRPVAKDRQTLLMRLKELAFPGMRYGYRQLTILLQRQGWKVGKRLVYQLHRPENLLVRTKQRKKRAAQIWVPLAVATAANQRWSMDFMS